MYVTQPDNNSQTYISVRLNHEPQYAVEHKAGLDEPERCHTPFTAVDLEVLYDYANQQNCHEKTPQAEIENKQVLEDIVASFSDVSINSNLLQVFCYAKLTSYFWLQNLFVEIVVWDHTVQIDEVGSGFLELEDVS